MTTFTWTSALSGQWSSSGNWTPSGPPTGAGNDALINASGAAYTVSYNVPSLTISSLTINSANATLSFVSGDALTLDGSLTITAGTLDVTSLASLSADDASSDNGRLDVNGGTIELKNSLSLASGALLTVENSGGTLSTDGLTTISNGATAIINSAGAVTVTGSLVVNGLLEASAGTGAIAFSSIHGTGTVEANGATLDLQSRLSMNSGIAYDIANSAPSVLTVGGPINAGNTIAFLGTVGEFAYTNATTVKTTISGLNVGSSTTIPTNFVGLTQQGPLTVASGGTGTGVAGTLVLSNGDTLTLSGITNGTLGWKVDTRADASGNGTDIFLSVCYAAGTRIMTPRGERTVEGLACGDMVLTQHAENLEPRSVRWLGHRRVGLAHHPRPETVAPIRIQRGAFADGMPHRDLVVSPDHGIFVAGKLICARQLVNGTTIRQEFDWTAVDYYHVELDQHAILLAEGLPAESYIDTGNRGFFSNSSTPTVLHPDLTDQSGCPTREAGSCAPFVWDEASVRPVWQGVAERAAAIGQPVPQRATTADAGLRLAAKGRTVKPIYSDSDHVIFALPSGAREVRLVSRAQMPTDARPWLEDRRRLGVCVARLLLRGADEMREVPVDHPNLIEGWWAVERNGQVISRWTDGDAVLPLPEMPAVAMLEIRMAGTMTFVMSADEVRQAEIRAA